MTTSTFVLSPVFRYNDAPAAIDWLVRAFGFTVRSDHRTPDGAVAHADLLFGSNTVGVSSASASSPASPWTRVRQGLYVRVGNPDAVHDRAVAAGAGIVSPLTDMDYGSRDFSLRDVGGHLWGFGTYDTGAAAGEPAIWPELQYPDAPAAVAWLTRALGFEPTLEVADGHGALMHAELRHGFTVVMLGPASPGHECGDTRQVVGLRVDDVDAHCETARTSGATIVRGPETAPYGARFYAARDPEGFLWWVTNYSPVAARLSTGPAEAGFTTLVKRSPNGRSEDRPLQGATDTN